MRVIQKRFNDPLEIASIGAIDFGCNLEWHVDALGNFDRPISSFFWRDPS
jgi:hypothetical protein